VVAVADADQNVLDGVDLVVVVVVVGGPTHAWSMSRARTRIGAPNYARKPGSGLVVEPGAATGPGVREWLGSIGQVRGNAAAFDTRIKAPAIFTGRASKAIGRLLSRHGLAVVANRRPAGCKCRCEWALHGEPRRRSVRCSWSNLPLGSFFEHRCDELRRGDS
jgi:hypothetical protein